MILLYHFSIQLYYVAIRFAALWNKKAVAWVEGRKNWQEKLQSKLRDRQPVIWMHCASAGEFEQGKPVIETLKKEYPHYKILISFFSPSGYEVAKNYKPADCIIYLPLDTKKNAQEFLQIVKPKLVIFIKYEFWYYYLQTVAKQNIPLILVSAVFRKTQVFFQWYGGFFKKILTCFQHIFVQDKAALDLLKQHAINQSSVSGDTRFDRVNQIAARIEAMPVIENFIGESSNVIIAGSTWQDDEKLLADYVVDRHNCKLILAPHEINESHLSFIRKLFPAAVLYSQYIAKNNWKEAQVLVIDNVGLLARLYAYAAVTYVGGGFTKDGIHNILEAAVWGKPVLFGPNYKKYREAGELIKAGGGFTIKNGEALKKLADDFFSNKDHRQATSRKARNYIEQNTGATNAVLRYIQENRLLTKP